MANQYRDSGWKTKNSLFMLFFLLPLCFPWPFIIMAGKVESKKFRRLGLLYFLIGVVLLITFFISMETENDGVGIATMLIGIMIHLFALAHGCILMGEYYRLLAERENMLNMGPYNAPYNNTYGLNYGYESQPRIPMDNLSMLNMPQGAPAQQYAPMPNMMQGGQPVSLQKPQGYPQMPNMQPNMQGGYNAAQAMGSGMQSMAGNSVNAMQNSGMMMNSQVQGRLNINTCTEEELAALPGMNIIDAKKAVSHRQQYGDFGSIEELVVLLGLKPHIAAPLYDILYCEGSGAPQNMSGSVNQGSGRRTLDI